MSTTTQKGQATMEDIELSPEAQSEQVALRASIERMRAERLEIDAQNRALQALIEREDRIAAHLRKEQDR